MIHHPRTQRRWIGRRAVESGFHERCIRPDRLIKMKGPCRQRWVLQSKKRDTLLVFGGYNAYSCLELKIALGLCGLVFWHGS